jgi:hypothetical protein
LLDDSGDELESRPCPPLIAAGAYVELDLVAGQ